MSLTLTCFMCFLLCEIKGGVCAICRLCCSESNSEEHLCHLQKLKTVELLKTVKTLNFSNTLSCIVYTELDLFAHGSLCVSRFDCFQNI